MKLTLADVERCLSGAPEEGHDTIIISGVKTDSRTVGKGDLFVCIDGDNFDGHEFAEGAVKSGAVAVIASRMLGDVGVPAIMVRDTVRGLGQIASCWRDICGAKLVAVTGTAGKTTVKEMLHAVISQKFNAAKNYRNFNNQIGLPMSMLKATCDQAIWIMELGISERGDMEDLAPVASPDIAVITNVGPGHLEGLGDEAGVAEAKTTLLKHLRSDGAAIISADYPLLVDAANEIVDKPIYFSANHFDQEGSSARRKDDSRPPRSLPTQGFESSSATQQLDAPDQNDTSYVASFLGGEAEGWGRFTLRTPEGDGNMTAPFSGHHYAENLACVAAVCHQLGISREEFIAGVQSLAADPQRFCCREIGTATLIDDTYNANPLSMTRSIDTAKTMADARPLVLLLGDMRELGDEAVMQHEKLGSHISKAEPAACFYKGDHFDDVASGLADNDLVKLDDIDEFLMKWRELELINPVILVKGSRSLKMEEYANALSRELTQAAGTQENNQ